MLVGHVLSHLSPPSTITVRIWNPGDLVPTKELQTQVESRKRRWTASLPLGKCVFCWGNDIFFLGDSPIFRCELAGDWCFREGNSCDGHKLSSSVIYVSRLISEFLLVSVGRLAIKQDSWTVRMLPTFFASQSHHKTRVLNKIDDISLILDTAIRTSKQSTCFLSFPRPEIPAPMTNGSQVGRGKHWGNFRTRFLRWQTENPWRNKQANMILDLAFSMEIFKKLHLHIFL